MGKRNSCRSSLRSLADLGEQVYFRCGAWHLPASAEVRIVDGPVFSTKPGPRRVVLQKIEGPNAIGYARTTSGDNGLEHDRHRHHDFSCRIDAENARVVVSVPIRVKVGSLSSETYSCLEPDDTELHRCLLERRR